MDSSLSILLSVIIPVVITSLVSLYLGKRQSRNIKVDIESQYQEMLSKEIEERKKLADRFNELEKKLKEYMRAYEYSIRHIKKMNELFDPEKQVPDFLNWTTEELRRYWKDNYGD